MKKTFNLKSIAMAVAVASSSIAAVAPATVQAEVEYNASVSNMYLWRGTDISNGQAIMSGGVDYGHESGAYVGMWAASEDGGTEYDLYGGYAAEFGGVGIDLGYIAYFYPSDTGTDSSMASDNGGLITEAMIGVSFQDLSVTAFINMDGDDADADGDGDGDNYKYLSVDYAMDKFGFHYGMTMTDADKGEYSDVNVSYAATDAFTITVSKAMGDAVEGSGENPLINLSYSLPL